MGVTKVLNDPFKIGLWQIPGGRESIGVDEVGQSQPAPRLVLNSSPSSCPERVGVAAHRDSVESRLRERAVGGPLRLLFEVDHLL